MKETSQKPSSQQSRTPAKRGNMKPAEIQPLVMAARKAFDAQERAGLTDDLDFDAWRHQQCLAAVGKPGITACNHGDFQPLLAHFQTLAGDDAAALRSLLKSGKPTDHAEPGDTHEARRQIAHEIVSRLDFHIYLAETPLDQILAAGRAEWESQSTDLPYPGPDPEWLRGIKSRKAAIDGRGKGPISAGYVVWLVRQKTRRPDLTLGRDLQTGLAERCTVRQLDQILFTLINRINAAEGVGHTSDRNKSQRRR